MNQPSDNKRSERVTRRITGIVIGAVLAALWIFRGWPARICLIIAMALMMWEMYGAFEQRGDHPVKWIGIVYALCILPAYLFIGAKALGLLPAIFAMAGFTAVILKGKPDFPGAGATVVPLVCPGLLMSLMLPLLDVSSEPLSAAAFGLSLLIPLGNDVAAYAIGIRFGKRKLCPELSPKKSVEGAVAGIVASVVISILVPIAVSLVMRCSLSVFPPLWHFMLIGLVGGAAAPVGDLTASMIKRYCGIKDFGHLLPGHGGMMDRLDSVMFTGAVVYAYFVLVLNVL